MDIVTNYGYIGISAAFEKIPILPKIIEQLEEQLIVFCFSIIAPFIVPLIRQIRSELKTGSEEIIQSSKNEQHIVWENDRSVILSSYTNHCTK